MRTSGQIRRVDGLGGIYGDALGIGCQIENIERGRERGGGEGVVAVRSLGEI